MTGLKEQEKKIFRNQDQTDATQKLINTTKNGLRENKKREYLESKRNEERDKRVLKVTHIEHR